MHLAQGTPLHAHNMDILNTYSSTTFNSWNIIGKGSVNLRDDM